MLPLLALMPVGFCAEKTPLFEPAPDLKKSSSFAALRKAKPGTKVYELYKIEYLLERITRSDCTFIRNREKHKGRTAVRHMRWKLKKYEREVNTAYDFVNRIASSSRKTQETYAIKMKDGKIYKSQDVLSAELEFLTQALHDAGSKT